MRDLAIRSLLGWACYLAGAVPFVAFVAVFISGVTNQESLQIIAVNLLIFGVAGVTAILVKNMAFNAFMGLNAVPYAAFLIDRLGTDPSTWSSDDVKGSVVYVSFYCILGTVATVAWSLYKVPSIWHRAKMLFPH